MKIKYFKLKKSMMKIFLIISAFFTSIIIAKADGMPGARSATSSAGDVFLGGNYIEIGISKSGSFGTSTAAPAEFKSHALSQYSYRLGLISDGDGWDVGEAPTSGDFFLPGSPYEGYIISYTIDGTNYTYSISERTESTWRSNAISGPTTSDQSDLEKGILKAVVTVVTKENVEIEMIHQFGVDDIYYSTIVKFTNLSDKKLTNASFKRDLDPDNDKDFKNTYDTYNKVICNPNPAEEGSSTNYAMVVARGPITFNGFFFVSFDNRAAGMINNTIQSGLPTYATDESLAISTSNSNGYIRNDINIQLITNFGTINSNESDETTFYSSLDPNVINSIANILKAVSASIKKYTDTRIEIDTQDGYEYSINNGATWQESGIFDGLEPGKEYTILSRIKATETSEASEPESITISTKNSGKTTPNISGLLATEDSIIVQNMENYEYSIDGGDTWQREATFNNLAPDTEYIVIARYIETDSEMYGTLTDPVTIRTLPKTSTILDNVDNVDIEITLDNNAPIVEINKGKLYEVISTDEDIVDAGNEDINIKFIIEALELDSDATSSLEKELKGNEKIAFTIDATIELYINNSYIKNIEETSTPMTFTIKIPDEYKKSNRKFFMIRKHTNANNETTYERLEDEDNSDDTITVSSSKFSDFTIAYEDMELSDNPNTVDNINLIIIMLIISILGLIISAKHFIKKIEINYKKY